MLPAVAAEVSTPLAKCKRIQMVSDGDGPVGASKVVMVLAMMTKMLMKMMMAFEGISKVRPGN